VSFLRRLIIAAGCVLCLSGAAAAQSELVTELAQRHVDITAQFTGEKVLIFGAVSHPGDVIIKVASPNETVAISRKAKYGPFWLTSGKFNVKDAPGLLYILSDRPLEELIDEAQRQRYGLSLKHSLSAATPVDVPADVSDWKGAFLDLKKRDGYYLEDGKAVDVVGSKLFSASMTLPAKLPLGDYKLTIYLVRGGKVVARQTRSLEVREVRIERWVSEVAYSHSWLFGIAFTLAAMVLGLVLGIALRKGGDD